MENIKGQSQKRVNAKKGMHEKDSIDPEDHNETSEMGRCDPRTRSKLREGPAKSKLSKPKFEARRES